MNRLSASMRKGAHPYLAHAKAPVNLGKYAHIRPVAPQPIAPPFGRGYGLPHQHAKMLVNKPSMLPLGKVSAQFLNARHYAEAKAKREVALESDLSTLVDHEIKSIEQYEEDSLYNNIGQEYLSKSKMTIIKSEDEGKVMLVGTNKNTSIKISFNREADEEEEPYENEENEAREEEDEEEDIDEEDEVENHKQFLNVEITYTTKDGKPKGQLLLDAFAGKDDRLYIDSMAVKKDGEQKQPRMYFAELSDDMQDRIYHYLEDFHIDDTLAQFVKQQVIRERSTEDIDFLKEFKSLIA